jgi:hypothetical protein
MTIKVWGTVVVLVMTDVVLRVALCVGELWAVTSLPNDKDATPDEDRRQMRALYTA